MSRPTERRSCPTLLRRFAVLVCALALATALAPLLPIGAAASAQEPCDPQQIDPPCPVEPTPDENPPSVTFTAPIGSTFGSAVQSVTIEFCDDSTLSSTSRRVTVGGVDVTSQFDYATATKTGCRAFARSTGTVTLSLGGQTLSASIRDSRGNRGSRDKGVTLRDGYAAASAGFNPEGHLRPEACTLSCFAATYAASTVPYYSLGAPRSVTVVYASERHFPRPFVFLDITGFTDDTPVLREFWLQVKVNGAFREFTNAPASAEDRTKLVFAAREEMLRLGGQVDASDLATGVYPMQLVLTTVTADSVSQVKSIDTRLVVVNEGNSSVGRGWSIAGLQRLVGGDSGSVVVTDGAGGAAYFGRCGTNCYSRPQGDVSRIDSVAGGWVRSYPDSTKVRFDGSGKMTSVTDRFGTAVNYLYDGSGRLWKIEDPYRTVDGGSARAAITLTYDANGLHEIRDPGPTGSGSGGRVTTFNVDANRRVTSIQDPDGLATQFGYDASGRLETVTDRRGGVTRYGYDATTWQVASVQAPQVEVIENGSPVLRTPTTTFRPWQEAAIPIGSTSPATPIHPDSTTARITDPIGRVSSFSVTKWGEPRRVVDPVGRVTNISYFGVYLDRIETPDGAVTDYGFNGDGQLVSIQEPGADRVFIRYGVAGQPDSIYYSGRMIERRVLKGPGGLVDSLQVPGTDSATTYTYDAFGRVLTVQDWRNHETRYRYESRFGNVDSVGTDNGAYTLTRYDDYGRVSGTRSRGSGGLGPWSTILYDSLNRTAEVADGVNTSPVKYEYDALFLTKVRDPKGQLYRVALNALGWVTHRYDPSDTTSWTRFVKTGYDAAGRAVALTNRRGQTVNYTLDALDRPTAKSGTNVMSATYSYSPDGLIAVSANAVARDSVFRSAKQWTDSVVTWIAGKRFRRLYKASKYRELDSIGVSTTSGITFAGRRYYRPSGLLDSVRVGTQVIRFGYNDHLQRDTTTWPGGSKRIEVYDTTHELVYTSFTNSIHDSHFWRNYTYDKLGRLSEEYRKLGNGPDVHRFWYDSLGQFRRKFEYESSSSVVCPEPSGTQIIYDGNECTSGSGEQTSLRSEEFVYDPAGNLTSTSDAVTGEATAATYGTPNRLLTWTTQSGGVSYEHDLDGNRTRRLAGASDIRYGWDAEGRLATVTAGSRTITYDYDAAGRLVRRKINGAVDRHFLWDGDLLLAELNGPATSRIAEYAYLPGIDRPLALVTGATGIAATRFFQQDAMGDVDGVFTTSGIAQDLDYDVWGKWTSTLALADTNRLRWKGLVYEGDSTKLYYVRNRWYDPETGRFMTEDPLGLEGGMNLYVFGGNDHINSSDPFGLDYWVEGTACPQGYRVVGQALVNGAIQSVNCVANESTRSGWSAHASARGSSKPAGGSGTGGGGGDDRTFAQCGVALADAALTVAGDAAFLIPGAQGASFGLKALRAERLASNAGRAGTKMLLAGAYRDGRIFLDRAADIRATGRALAWWGRVYGHEAAVTWSAGAWVTGLKQGVEGVFPEIAPFIPIVASAIAIRDAMKACE